MRSKLAVPYSVLIVHPWWQQRWCEFFAAAGTAWWQCSHIETVADWVVGLVVGRLVGWLVGWLAGRLVGWLTGQEHSAEVTQSWDGVGLPLPAHLLVSQCGDVRLFVFTSCCSAVSLPPSSPRPGPCGSHV